MTIPGRISNYLINIYFKLKINLKSGLHSNILKYPYSSVQCHVREYSKQKRTAAADIVEIQNRQCCKNFAGFTYPVVEKKLVIACAKMSSAANQTMLMSGKCRP
jgi:hypothetical protein